MTPKSQSPDLRHFQDQTHTPRSFGTTYVASPYSSDDPAIQQARLTAAIQITGTLVSRGEPVFSPVIYTATILANGHAPPQGWYEFDIHFLQAATDMLVLHIPGWRDSRGMLLELAFAKARQMPIRHMNWEAIKHILDEETQNTLLKHSRPAGSP